MITNVKVPQDMGYSPSMKRIAATSSIALCVLQINALNIDDNDQPSDRMRIVSLCRSRDDVEIKQCGAGGNIVVEMGVGVKRDEVPLTGLQSLRRLPAFELLGEQIRPRLGKELSQGRHISNAGFPRILGKRESSKSQGIDRSRLASPRLASSSHRLQAKRLFL